MTSKCRNIERTKEKMKKNIIIVAAVSMMLTSCGLYKKYEQKSEIPADAIGVPGAASAEAPLSWREFFTDPLLQKLIEQELANNTDLAAARIKRSIAQSSQACLLAIAQLCASRDDSKL